MESGDRPSARQRVGPFGRFLLGAVLVLALAFAGLMTLETAFALIVRTPTVDGLPDRVSVCGRTYQRAAGASQDLLTLDEVRGTGIEPVVVLPLRIQPCVDGARERGGDGGGRPTVVFVRVEGDRYAAYELLGGP